MNFSMSISRDLTRRIYVGQLSYTIRSAASNVVALRPLPWPCYDRIVMCYIRYLTLPVEAIIRANGRWGRIDQTHGWDGQE